MIFKTTDLYPLWIAVSLVCWSEGGELPRHQAHPSTEIASFSGRTVNSNSIKRATVSDTVTVWFEDFESGADEWAFDPGWALTDEESYSPIHSVTADDDSFGAVLSLISPSIAIPEIEKDEKVHFNFAVRADIPDYNGSGSEGLEDSYNVDVANADEIPWHRSEFEAFDGKSWWCGDENLNGYGDGWLQFLDSPAIAIPSSGETKLTLKLQYAIETYEGGSTSIDNCLIDGWDAANVRLSTDGGTTWQVISGSPNYASGSCFGFFHNGESCSTAGWGGTSSGWKDGSFDLSGFAGNTVIIRFAFGSDPEYSTSDDVSLIGFFLDDISVDNSGSGNLMLDNADDQVVMQNQAGLAWQNVFYDYGGGDRPGALQWEIYQPGYPYNGNVDLDLSDFAGKNIRLRFQTHFDENDDGGNGNGLFIDDVHVWKKIFSPFYPVPQELSAEGGDGKVTLTWDPVETGVGGELFYDSDDGISGDVFTEGIYTTQGFFYAGEYFNTAFGAELETARIFGYFSNTKTSTTLAAFDAVGGKIESEPKYSKTVKIEAGEWNEIDLSSDSWSFEGEFVLAMEVGTYENDSLMFVALDESVAPSGNSYTLFDEWFAWQDIAVANDISDGEWGIRAVVSPGESFAVAYNVYRRSEGISFDEPLLAGTGVSEASFKDYDVMNGQTYIYAVSALFDLGTAVVESGFSNEAAAIPLTAGAYILVYDDGSAESGATSLGEGGHYAVRFTPTGYPAGVLEVELYAKTGGGSAWVRFWDDDGDNGFPGNELGGGVLVEGIVEGWNEISVTDPDVTVNDGDIYIGWEETADSPNLGLDFNDDVDGRSHFRAAGGSWEPLSNLYAADLMIRALMEGAVSVASPQSDAVPLKFSLGQNYPNPFNPMTTIPFALPREGRASLILYDINGRSVKTLLDEHIQAGQHRVFLDGRDLASGIYFCRLTARSFSASRKIVFLK